MVLFKNPPVVQRKDPWARLEAWRNTPEFSNKAFLRRSFYGFGWGLAAFLVLATVDELYWKPKERREAAEWKRTHPHH